MILSIESAHCIGDLKSFVSACYQLMSPHSSLVIADLFPKAALPSLEALFTSSNFLVHKKEVITFNVKHALNLDKPRVAKILANSFPGNQFV